MASGSTSWFHGYVAWYLRGTIWFVQSAVIGVGSLMLFGTDGLLGTVGTVLAGLLAALLLFRQVDLHIQQELGE